MPATEQHPATMLLVDDHPLMRKGQRALLEGEPGLAVAGERGHTRAQLVGSTDLENQTLRAGTAHGAGGACGPAGAAGGEQVAAPGIGLGARRLRQEPVDQQLARAVQLDLRMVVAG